MKGGLSRMMILVSPCLMLADAPLLEGGEPVRTRLLTGVDANYSLDMERGGATWRWDGREYDLFEGMAVQGVRGFRVRVWTKDDGLYGTTYATEVVKRATRAGLDPYLVLFLSDDWADLMKQPAPEAWRDLAPAERAEVVRRYARDTVAHFRNEGLRSHMYEIGNEIDYGICGEYPGKGTKKNPETLSRYHWPRAARLILACQQGVREADPDAEFMLHIAHWWDADFCIAFFRFMLDQGIRIDAAGLSYFPSSNIGGSLEMEQFGDTVDRLTDAVPLPVIVAETAYPSTEEFKGQFARWRREVIGYPLTPEGQYRWFSDFVAFCGHHPDITAVYYWSPEWYGEGMWKAFALVDPAGEAKPAWKAFGEVRRAGPHPRRSIVVEVRDNEFYVVPVQEAKSRMIDVLSTLVKQAGGITVDYITRITDTELTVGAYRINLRASLRQNIDLELLDGAEGCELADIGEPAPDGLTALVDGVDRATERVVFVARGEPTPEVRQAVGFVESKGVETILHVKRDMGPLTFGMCGWSVKAGE